MKHNGTVRDTLSRQNILKKNIAMVHITSDKLSADVI